MNTFAEHIQWSAVKDVCSQLRDAGFQAVLAGGCVRDLIMRREPNDFDVATNATPDEIEGLFEKTIAVGKAFGVIVIPFEGFQIEVATFREDLAYKDGRRPEGVRFSTAQADSQRRDFTVNALFFDPVTEEIIDYAGGQRDIENQVLRAVGDPNQRFNEDKLRILRAIRFAAQLGFEIEPTTLSAIREHASEVSVVSRERVRDEISKLLKSENRRKGFELLISTGVLAASLPSFAAFVENVQAKWLQAWRLFDERRTLTNDSTQLLALFLWPAYQRPELVLNELRLSHQVTETLRAVFSHLERVLHPSTIRFGELALVFTKPFASDLLFLAERLMQSNALAHEVRVVTIWNRALEAARPDGKISAEPYITGKDLIRLGLKPGPHIGEVLREVFLLQLEGELTSKDEAERHVLALIKNQLEHPG